MTDRPEMNDAAEAQDAIEAQLDRIAAPIDAAPELFDAGEDRAPSST